jgi:tRNA(Ile)-lysidine synthetase-like protein
MNLPVNFLFIKEYDNIYIIEENQTKDYSFVFDKFTHFGCEYFHLLDKGHMNEGVYLSDDDYPITIRTMRAGDSIMTSSGTKKLSRLFINAKVPALKRKVWPVVVNKDGIGKLSAFNGNEFATTAVADLTYSVKGNMLQVAIKRSDIAETATVDLEFKWTDSVDAAGNFLNLYKDGSVAPYGRFNYLYTEIEQTTLTEAQRNEMYQTSTSVIKAGSPKMIANGGKMYVHEADIRVAPFEER